MSENKKTIVINLVAVNKPDRYNPCSGCYFNDTSFFCANYKGKTEFPCSGGNRKDHRSIIWKEV